MWSWHRLFLYESTIISRSINKCDSCKWLKKNMNGTLVMIQESPAQQRLRSQRLNERFNYCIYEVLYIGTVRGRSCGHICTKISGKYRCFYMITRRIVIPSCLVIVQSMTENWWHFSNFACIQHCKSSVVPRSLILYPSPSRPLKITYAPGPRPSLTVKTIKVLRWGSGIDEYIKLPINLLALCILLFREKESKISLNLS